MMNDNGYFKCNNCGIIAHDREWLMNEIVSYTDCGGIEEEVIYNCPNCGGATSEKVDQPDDPKEGEV